MAICMTAQSLDLNLTENYWYEIIDILLMKQNNVHMFLGLIQKESHTYIGFLSFYIRFLILFSIAAQVY